MLRQDFWTSANGPLFTETDEKFINSGTSGNSTVPSSSDYDLIASSTHLMLIYCCEIL